MQRKLPAGSERLALPRRKRLETAREAGYDNKLLNTEMWFAAAALGLVLGGGYVYWNRQKTVKKKSEKVSKTVSKKEYNNVDPSKDALRFDYRSLKLTADRFTAEERKNLEIRIKQNRSSEKEAGKKTCGPIVAVTTADQPVVASGTTVEFHLGDAKIFDPSASGAGEKTMVESDSKKVKQLLTQFIDNEYGKIFDRGGYLVCFWRPHQRCSKNLFHSGSKCDLIPAELRDALNGVIFEVLSQYKVVGNLEY